MRTLALIPARGGSKGIPRKNIGMMTGRPLIGWTIAAALDAADVDAVVVSTEDAEIAEVARACGALVPFLRPPELAADETPGIDPVFHALDTLPGYDAVLLLQPTSPLRTTADIDAVLALASETGAQSIVSVTEAAEHPAWMYRMDSRGALSPLLDTPSDARRQDLPPVHCLNGALYFARVDWLREARSFVGTDTIGYAMPAERSIDIDALIDWRLAELLLAEREGG